MKEGIRTTHSRAVFKLSDMQVRGIVPSKLEELERTQKSLKPRIGPRYEGQLQEEASIPGKSPTCNRRVHWESIHFRDQQ